MATSHEVQPPALPSWEPSDLSGLKPDGLPWSSLVLSGFVCLSRGPPPFWLSREPFHLSELDMGSPPWLAAISPLRVFLGGSRVLYIVHLLYILHSDSIRFTLFCSVKHSFQMLCFSQLSMLKTILFDYFFYSCLIIVQYSDPGNVFQVFWSCKEVTIICNLKLTNISTNTRLTYFHLSIWFSKAYCHHKH
jgi:hypothetical protein